MRRALIIVATVALLTVGLGGPSPVQAGSGSSTTCSTSSNDEYTTFRIIESPVTLALRWTTLPYSETTARRYVYLCYSSSPVGYGGLDGFGGTISAQNRPDHDGGDDTAVDCTPQSNPTVVAPSCHLGVEGNSEWQSGTYEKLTYGVNVGCVSNTPVVNATCNASAGTGYESYAPWLVRSDWWHGVDLRGRTVIPIWLCTPSCTNASPTVDPPDAAIFVNIDTTFNSATNPSSYKPAGTDIGWGVAIPEIEYCTPGSCQSLTTSSQRVGAGHETSSVQFLPGTTGVKLPAGENLAAVQVGNTVIPVTTTTGACVSSWDIIFGTSYYC